MIGTRQYRKLESSCAGALPAREPENIEAAGKAMERETNSSDPLTAPKATKGQETNAPCPREMAKSMGARATNVPEKETATVRRDGEPLTSAAQERQQGETAAAEHQAAGELASPSQGGQGRTSRAQCARTVQQAMGVDAGPEGATSHTCGSRRQLIQLLKDGSEYFTPKEVRWIVQEGRLRAKGSLNALDMLEDENAAGRE